MFVNNQPCRIPSGGYGRVWLIPDPAKGNACPQVPFGEVDADGKFRVKTRDVDGAPAGWYTVQVRAKGPLRMSGKKQVRDDLLPPRYADARRSDLAVQVAADGKPQGYELKTRK